MFTVDQIEKAHKKVKTGADFPNYIHDIKGLGVVAFETFVYDSHTVYFGDNNFQTESKPKYKPLTIADRCDIAAFNHSLKVHQLGKTDYNTFCKHCAEAGIEKWFVDLQEMICTYYDKPGKDILTEKIPE